MTDKDEAEAKKREALAASDRIRYQWMLESVSKFRFFFAGLVFAILSFSVQFAVETTEPLAKWFQALAWVFLLLTGMFALRDAGGLVTKNVEKIFDGLSPRARRVMWSCFILGVVLLALARLFADGAVAVWILRGAR